MSEQTFARRSRCNVLEFRYRFDTQSLREMQSLPSDPAVSGVVPTLAIVKQSPRPSRTRHRVAVLRLNGECQYQGLPSGCVGGQMVRTQAETLCLGLREVTQ